MGGRFPNNLPHQLTSFIGRGHEMAEVQRLLTTTRLLTLTGAGSGKTRLALQVAAGVLDRYPDGVWLAELSSITDLALVPRTVAAALHIPEQPGHHVSESLADGLRSKSILLVLDNCEHLLSACAELVDSLLRACPRLQILATSREALGIAGETAWRVPSLSLPDLTRQPALERLTEYEAVRLFIERAVAVQPAFEVTPENAPGFVQLCAHLDGMPLAIELAAARAGTHSRRRAFQLADPTARPGPPRLGEQGAVRAAARGTRDRERHDGGTVWGQEQLVRDLHLLAVSDEWGSARPDPQRSPGKMDRGGAAARQGRPFVSSDNVPGRESRSQDPGVSGSGARADRKARVCSGGRAVSAGVQRRVDRDAGDPQEGVQREGHTPSAQNIPWAPNVREDGTFKAFDELMKLYENKGITPGKEIIAYCRIGERSSLTWFTLKYLVGFPHVRNYDGSWTEYGSLVGVPIEKGA